MKPYRILYIAAIVILIYPLSSAAQKIEQSSQSSIAEQNEGVNDDSIGNSTEQETASYQFRMGKKYLQGTGVVQDSAEAAKWFLIAANQGNASAQCMLGAMYATGLGVEKDSVQAYMWLTLSVEGSKNTETPYLQKAKEISQSISKEMTPEQIEEARNRARSWKPAQLSTPKQIGGEVLKSMLIRRVEPVYPEMAKRTRVQGLVILVVTVDEEGSVTEIRATRGEPILVEAAIEAVRQWKYTPTLISGKPVPVTATVTVGFYLGR